MAEDVSFTVILCFRVFFGLLLVHFSTATCEQFDVGVSWYIHDNQLTASSELNAGTPAKNGRLNFVAGSSWCASSSDSSPYLQIDVRIPHIICAVSTQGNSQGSQWVESYTLQSSTDGTTWTDYKENGQVKTFNGNFDQNKVEKQILFSAFVARYLRFVVGSKHGGACLRVEVSGVPRRRVQSNIALFKLTSESSTWSGSASNAVDGNRSPYISKCTHTQLENNPWWRVDLGRVEPVAEVNIVNRARLPERLDGAEIRVGNKTTNGGADNSLCADKIKIPVSSSKTYVCRPKAYGRYLYIRLLKRDFLTVCEVEVYSYLKSEGCDPVGVSNSSFISDQRFSASSSLSGHSPSDGRLKGSNAWIPATDNNNNDFLQIDLGSVYFVCGVATQGNPTNDYWTETYKIKTSLDNDVWAFYSEGGSEKTFTGNDDKNSIVRSELYEPLAAKFIRFYPVTFHSSKALRVEVYRSKQGCVLDPVGVSDSSDISDQRFSASSSLSGRSPSDGRLKGSNAWIPATDSNNNDFLQIDLGSVYFVCGVATQGNPNNDYWTKTYKIKTSLDNVWGTFYSEGGSEKEFTGNDNRNSIVRSELYEPLAAKFIRFYPVTFQNRKALRVEVYGSKQGCFESFKNERFQTGDFTITASSALSSHKASYSRLYGTDSWCSSSASLPQYLQADFGQIVTVTGVATQGDAQRNNRVTSYLIRYGYDGKTWISYETGQHLTGNSDRNTIVVHWFAPPFAAQYVRIFPKSHNGAICMRMDLFGCKDYQVSLPLNVDLDDVGVIANTSQSVTLTCVASYSPRQPSGYSWSKDGAGLSDTTPSLTIPYNNASNIYSNSCTRKLTSDSGVQCNSTYQCSASLSGIQGSHLTTANVIVFLKKPGKPVVQVNPSDLKARSALVTWPYNPGADEMPVTAYNLEYRNSTFAENISLGAVLSKRIINLKPYTSYSVRLIANSVLGKSLWSNVQNFATKTAKPEVDVQIGSVTSPTSQSIQVIWQTPSTTNLNGPLRGYSIEYMEAGKPSSKVNVSGSTASHTLENLEKWTVYFIKIAVSNGDFLGPLGPEKQVRTLEDAPSKPLNLSFTLQKPSEVAMPRMTVHWQQPVEQNGIIRKYRLVLTYTIDGRQSTITTETNNQTFSHSLDVFGGIQYSVEIWAGTVRLGPSLTGTKEVPEYKPSTSPHNITSKKINETTYRISWNPLPRNTSNGIVIAYEVNQTKLSTPRTARSVSSPSILQNTSLTFIVLTDLLSCSAYKVEVRAYTSAGPGVFGSVARDIVTSAPGAPTNLNAENPGRRGITLRWNKPVLHGEDVMRYKIIYQGTKDYYPEFKAHTGNQETESATLTMTITKLVPGTRYTFVVRAETHCGYGGNSSVVQESTEVDAPEPPKPREIQEIKVKGTGTSANVTVWPALQTNGPISDYQVLVHKVNYWSDEVSDWEKLESDVYIAAQIPASSVNPSMVFVVGDGKTYGDYENKQLSDGKKYKIYSRGLARRVAKKRSVDQNYLIGDASLIAQVEIEEVVVTQSQSPTEPVKGSLSAGAVVGPVIAVLLLVAVIAAVIFWRRRRRLRDQDSKSETHAMTAVNGAFDTVVDTETLEESPPAAEELVEGPLATSDPIYGNAVPDEIDEKPKPVPISRFSEYVTSLKRDKNAGFTKQYKMLSPGQQFSWDVAKVPDNKNKNRYGNIIAYDHSRVPLPLIDDVKHSDYINANYLHGYDGTPKSYIACQGPVPGTYQDFWRMIWQENVSTVVMLTRLVEHGRTKCHRYWPDKSETYHEITVSNHKTEKFADYAIRTFVLSKSGSKETRQVQQFHFLVWPDKGVPRHATAVLGLRTKVRAKHKDCKSPLVVHCSAGVGRTGAFIVIDAMLESAEHKKVIDVFNYVQLIRTNRISMVQTEEQYGFIYMALLESITCGNTEISSCDLRVALRKLASINPKTKTSGLASEYQRLDLITADDIVEKEDDVGRKPVNASKNRFPDVIPLNDSRVVLRGDEKNDYINASFVDTFRERNSFIMTQAPLSNTIEDFWRMVWDYNVGTIVMLNENEENGQVYPKYWPSEGSKNFGQFVIESTSNEVFQDFSERELTIFKRKDPKVVRRVHHYHVTGWADKNIPSNPQCILDLMAMVEQSQRSSGNEPVVVQCSNGVGRSGTFCAILSIIERLKSEQVIDVCQSVKVIRVNRPKAVDCKKQYVFCYNIVQKYLDSFNDYSNFN